MLLLLSTADPRLGSAGLQPRVKKKYKFPCPAQNLTCLSQQISCVASFQSKPQPHFCFSTRKACNFNCVSSFQSRLRFFRMIGSKTESGRHIPKDVLFDILLWLPVVSLLRFKGTCKYWRALIESSTFITQHLHRSSREEALVVYGTEYVDYKRRTSKDLLMLIDGNEYKKCSKDYMHELLPSGHFAQLVGSCDGIVCLRTSNNGNLALYNPAVKQLRHLPEPSFLTPPTGAASRHDVVGFGFDSKTNDYKVVRILCYADRPSSRVHKSKIVEVYSKRRDSWRTLRRNRAPLPFALIDSHPHTTSKDGTCFWLGTETDDGTYNFVVSFDLKDEVFGAMPLPDGRLSDMLCALDFLNGSLVYIKGVDCTTFCEGGYQYFEIWMLHEFGIKESWNRIYKIGPLPKIKGSPFDEYYYPVKLSKSGDFVILMRRTAFSEDRNGGQLHLFNLRTQGQTYPLIHPPNCWAFHVFSYQESLVSVKTANNNTWVFRVTRTNAFAS